MQCSFCHKGEEAGCRKLISSPSDYPRAYICDECVAMCAAIIEDDKAGPEPPVSEGNDPVTSELLPAVAQWIVTESLGQPAHKELAQLREVASRLFVANR